MIVCNVIIIKKLNKWMISHIFCRRPKTYWTPCNPAKVSLMAFAILFKDHSAYCDLGISASYFLISVLMQCEHYTTKSYCYRSESFMLYIIIYRCNFKITQKRHFLIWIFNPFQRLNPTQLKVWSFCFVTELSIACKLCKKRWFLEN